MKNTGKSSEDAFEAYWTSKGKKAHLERLVDASEVYGRVGRRGFTKAQPSDYIVTTNGFTFFAEVKSTIDPDKFTPSLLKPKQRAKAAMITAAGGRYVVYVHAKARDQWYAFEFQEWPQHTTYWKDIEDRDALRRDG